MLLKSRLSLLLVLCVGAVVGNLVAIPLYQSITFIFGSVFSLMAARMYGVLPALLVAAVGSTVTIFNWGHPWAALVLVVEAGAVALLLRHTGNLMAAVAIFWATIGFWAILLSYALLLDLPWGSAAFIAFKQTFNAFLNAVLAGLALAALRMRSPWFKTLIPRVGSHTLIFYLIALATILSCVAMIIAESRSQYRFALGQVHVALESVALVTRHDLASGTAHPSHSAILEAAPGAVSFASGPPASAITDFAVAVIDRDGQPRMVHGTVFAAGESGQLDVAIDDVFYWHPDEAMPAMARWRQSRFVYTVPVSDDDAISAVHVEYRVAPILDWLESKAHEDLITLGAATGVTLVLAYIIASWLVAPLKQLAHLSQVMDRAVRSGVRMDWLRETGVAEYDTLSATLETTAKKLARGFEERATLTQELEKRVRERTAQLDLLNQVVRQTRNGIVVTDVAGRITWANGAFTHLTGYPLEELVGQVPGELLQKTPPPPDVREAMQAGLASGEGFEVELVNHTRDGRPYRVEILCSPLHDQHGIHSGFIAIQIDVTERYGLEERLRQSQKLEAVGQLTTGLAHDFNNLLSVILGCAELLESKVEDKPDLRKLIAMTIGAAERGSDLTRSLLAFSRRQPLDPQTADLAALTKEFAPLLRRTLGENIRLTILADEAPWTVRVDVSQYESAVLNLAVNARDAMAEGGTLSIRISNKDIDRTEIADLKDVRPGPYVCVDVADNGHGMPPEVLERVFEPFFSTKPKHNNSGLGLSMVFGFLAQSGGFVRIESKVDKGTKISLFFPRATAKEDEGPNAGDA